METTPTANNVANNETKTIKATAKTRKPRTTTIEAQTRPTIFLLEKMNF